MGRDNKHRWGPVESESRRCSCELQSLLLPAGGPSCPRRWSLALQSFHVKGQMRSKIVCEPIKACDITSPLQAETTCLSRQRGRWRCPPFQHLLSPPFQATQESRSRLRPEQMLPVPGHQLHLVRVFQDHGISRSQKVYSVKGSTTLYVHTPSLWSV